MSNVDYTFTGTTPAGIQDEVVKWLREQSTNHSVKARIANRLKVKYVEAAKSTAFENAADFIAAIKHQPLLPRSNKCPNCGEELL